MGTVERPDRSVDSLHPIGVPGTHPLQEAAGPDDPARQLRDDETLTPIISTRSR